MPLYTLKETPCQYLHPPLQKIVTGTIGANINDIHWYGMSYVRVCTIYSMDMHHILIILESKCAMYIMHDAPQTHVIEWLLHKISRDNRHRLHQYSQDMCDGLYMALWTIYGNVQCSMRHVACGMDSK